MPYRIYRHPDVEQDLLDIINLVAKYAGTSIAKKKLAQIEQSIKNLSQTPNIGSRRDDIYPDLRAIPSARKAVITFTVDEDEQVVYIVSITYAGADWITRLDQRIDS